MMVAKLQIVGRAKKNNIKINKKVAKGIALVILD